MTLWISDCECAPHCEEEDSAERYAAGRSRLGVVEVDEKEKKVKPTQVDCGGEQT